MVQFDHEKLIVYQISLDFVSLAHEISDQLAPGRACLGDQLRRAATSITLNIAEGAGEFSKKEKARFYRMAMRSGTECAAVLDIARQIGEADSKRLEEGREMLLRIVSMLVKLVKSVREAEGTGGKGTGRGKGTAKMTTWEE